MRIHASATHAVFENNGSELGIFRVKNVFPDHRKGEQSQTTGREFAYIFFRNEPECLFDLISEAKEYVQENWDDVFFLVEMDNAILDTNGICNTLSECGFIPISHDAKGQTRKMWWRGNK